MPLNEDKGHVFIGILFFAGAIGMAIVPWIWTPPSRGIEYMAYGIYLLVICGPVAYKGWVHLISED